MMDYYEQAREAGTNAAAALTNALIASTPEGLSEYARASWLHDALQAAGAVVNADHRDAFKWVCDEYAYWLTEKGMDAVRA
jgi:hypothetical protein